MNFAQRIFAALIDSYNRPRTKRPARVVYAPLKGRAHTSRGFTREAEKFVAPFYTTDANGQRRRA